MKQLVENTDGNITINQVMDHHIIVYRCGNDGEVYKFCFFERDHCGFVCITSNMTSEHLAQTREESLKSAVQYEGKVHVFNDWRDLVDAINGNKL